jgi:hypothetical protein
MKFEYHILHRVVFLNNAICKGKIMCSTDSGVDEAA